MSYFAILLIGLLCLNVPGKAQSIDLQPQWNGGFQLASENGDYQLGIGANIQVDMGRTLPMTTFPEELDSGQSRMLLRRARLYLKGVMHEHFQYKVQFEFAGGDVAMKDVYLTIQDVPGLRNIRIGHFKEPFMHDYLSSSKTLMFMGRALPVNTVPGRNAGAMIYRPFFDKRMAWFGGGFFDVGSLFNATSLEKRIAIANRIVGLPLWQNNGSHLLHVGAAYRFRPIVDTEYNIDVSPESSITDPYLQPNSLKDIGSTHLVGGELIWHYRAFTVQGEYIREITEEEFTQETSTRVRTFYGQVSWMLNGTREYDRGNMTLDKVAVDQVLMGEGKGMGGLEIAARYSSLRTPGWGERYRSVQNVTLGLNWYLTPGIKMSGNYIASIIDNGLSNIGQFRVQLSF